MAGIGREVYDLGVLAAALEKARRGNAFDAFEYHEVEATLQSAIAVDERVPRSERRRIVNVGIQDAAQAGPITARSLRAGVRRAEQRFLATPTFQAVLVAEVSLSLPHDKRAKSLFGGRLTLARYLPRNYVEARAGRPLAIPEQDRQHRNYSWFIARYHGRSVREAYDVTIQKVDLTRSFWNFRLNRQTLLRFSSGSPEPVNRIRLGRAHTIHAPRGQTLMDGYWFDPAFVEQHSPGLSDSDWQAINSEHRAIQRRMTSHPYRALLEKAFVRYVRALDLADMETSFLKLWSLLEYLTATPRAQSDITVRRTLFLFKDRESTKQVLEHLRDQRNALVHEDPGLDDAQTFVYQLKRYVERLLVFHLNSGRRYRTLDEACTLLDQPASKPALQARIRYAKRALHFMGS